MLRYDGVLHVTIEGSTSIFKSISRRLPIDNKLTSLGKVDNSDGTLLSTSGDNVGPFHTFN